MFIVDNETNIKQEYAKRVSPRDQVGRILVNTSEFSMHNQWRLLIAGPNLYLAHLANNAWLVHIEATVTWVGCNRMLTS